MTNQIILLAMGLATLSVVCPYPQWGGGHWGGGHWSGGHWGGSRWGGGHWDGWRGHWGGYGSHRPGYRFGSGGSRVNPEDYSLVCSVTDSFGYTQTKDCSYGKCALGPLEYFDSRGTVVRSVLFCDGLNADGTSEIVSFANIHKSATF